MRSALVDDVLRSADGSKLTAEEWLERDARRRDIEALINEIAELVSTQPPGDDEALAA